MNFLKTVFKWLFIYPLILSIVWGGYAEYKRSQVAETIYLHCSEEGGAKSLNHGEWERKEFILAIAKDDNGNVLKGQSEGMRWVENIFALNPLDVTRSIYQPFISDLVQTSSSYNFDLSFGGTERYFDTVERIEINRADLKFAETESYQREDFNGNTRRDAQFINALRTNGIRAGQYDPVREKIAYGNCRMTEEVAFKDKKRKIEEVIALAEEAQSAERNRTRLEKEEEIKRLAKEIEDNNQI